MISTLEKASIRRILVLLAFLAMPALAAQGDGAQSLLAARKALAHGDGIAAEVELRRALAAGLPRENVAASMGEAELLQGDLVEARRWLGEGDFAPGDRGYGFRMLGRLEMRDGDLPAAGQAFDEALRVTPDDALLWVDIGRLRYRGGEQRQAIDASIRALQLDPDNPRALEFRGQLLRDSKGYRAALPFFAKGLKRAPDDLALMGEYAATLGELGRVRQMLAVTRRMIEIQPKNSRAFFLQAVLAARAGQYELARTLLWRTDDDFRKAPAAKILGGVLELKAGNIATAIDHFERLHRMQPDNARAELLLARALWQAGNLRELVERFGARALRDDASPYLTALVGRSYEALGERGQAAIYLDRVARPHGLAHAVLNQDLPLDLLQARWRVDPASADMIIPYVRELIAQRRFDDAAAVAEGQLERFGGSAEAQMLAGDVRFAARHFAAALERYGRSAEIRLSKPLLRRMLLSYQALGQAARGRALLRAYAEQHPRDGEVALLLSDSAIGAQDWRAAIALLDCALQFGGSERDPRLLLQRSLAKLGTGDVEAARLDAERAYRWQRSSGRASRILALAFEQSRQPSVLSTLLLDKATRIDAGVGPEKE